MDNQKVDISVELSGSVEDVIYKNADNGYTVINLGCDEGLIAVVGNLGDVNEGERLSLDNKPEVRQTVQGGNVRALNAGN